jgi:Helix-turn-helix domain
VTGPDRLKHGQALVFQPNASHHTGTVEILAQRGSQRAVLRPSAVPAPQPSPEHTTCQFNALRSSEDRKGPDVSTSATLPALLSITRAASILGLTRATAYRYAAAGELPIKRLGGRMYIITAKIRPLIDGTEEQAA